MISKKVVCLLFSILLLSSFLVFAEERSVFSFVKEVDANILAGQDALYEITLQNRGSIYDVFFIKPDPSSVAPFSLVSQVLDIEQSQVTLAPYEKKTFQVTLHTQDEVLPGTYESKLLVSSARTSEVLGEVILHTYILSPDHLIEMRLVGDETLVPGRDASFKVSLRSKEVRPLKNVLLTVSSTLFSEERSVDVLVPGEWKVETFNFPLSAFVSPEEYLVRARAYDGSLVKGEVFYSFSVLEKTDVSMNLQVIKSFLRQEVVIVRTNDGNSQVLDAYEYKIGEGLFSSVTPEAQIIEKQDGSYYLFEYPLDPQGSQTISIVTDYRPLLFLILLLLFGGFLFYRLRKKDLFVSKSVLPLGDGGYKVFIHIKNKTIKSIYHVKVIDLLPKFAVYKNFLTLKPVSVQTGEKSYRFLWDIDQLLAHEERIIGYEIDVTFHEEEALVLPHASVQYRKKGGIVNLKSNRGKVL